MSKGKLTRRSFMGHSAVTAAGIGLGGSVLASSGKTVNAKIQPLGSIVSAINLTAHLEPSLYS
jgi:nitrous oxide reductase